MIKFFRSWNTDSAYNLAAEQYLFETKKPEESIILLWQNDNAVVVGRYQNVFEEVDMRYAEKIRAKIVRRITGGGAVYHDLGNLNYSFIVGNDEELATCNDILMNALHELGLNAQFLGRNDIFVEGYKISGCASCRENGKILHHGTLLIDSDLSILEHVLTRKNKNDKNNKSNETIVSKSVKSQPKRVQNISSFIKNINIENIEAVIKTICGQEKITEEIKNNHRITELTHSRYNNYEWTYGFPPKYSYQNSRKFEAGYVCVNADIEAGRIKNVKFSGDFITLGDIEELERLLNQQNLSSSLKSFITDYGDNFLLGLQGKDLAVLFNKL